MVPSRTVASSNDKGPPSAGGESGQAVVEAAIVLPAMTFLVLTIMQLTMVQHARIMTQYAAYCAARAGIVYNADNQAMTQAATIALLPTMGRTDSLGTMMRTGTVGLALEKTRRLAFRLPIVAVKTLSPKAGDFTAALTRHLNGQEIDFDDIRSIAAKPNRLQIEVTYLYRMRIPFANSILQAIFFASRPGTYLLNSWGGFIMTNPEVGGASAIPIAQASYAGSSAPYAANIVAAAMAGGAVGGYYFPLKDTYSMRMQSNAFLRNAGQ